MAASPAMKHLASLRGLAVLLLAFTCLGAVIMMQLENGQLPDKRRGLQADQVDRNFLHKLYEIRTSKLVSREDFVAASRKQIAKWQEIRSGLEWNFNSAFLYCFTLYTTIGYGHAHPSSAAGKWFSVLYAMLGIPLFLVFAGRLSDRLQRWLRATLPSALAGSSSSRSGGDELPVSTTAALLAGHSLIGGLLYAATESWSVSDGAYFSMVSVSSVGLGDLTPGLESRARLGACLLHLTLGVGLCALLVNRLNSLLDLALLEAETVEQEKAK